MIWYRFLIEPIRYGILIITLYLLVRSVRQIPWAGILVSSGLYYFLAGAVFVIGVGAAALWVRHIQNIKGAWLVYALIGFGLATLYYMAVTSYVFGVYTFIPANRGGRLPLTRAYLQITEHAGIFTKSRTVGDVTLYGPVYIIEEHDDALFVASENMDKWLYEFVPIHAIRKEKVPYVYLERIEDGFPRVPRPSVDVAAAGAILKEQTSMFPAEFYQARRFFQYDYIYIDAVFLCIWLGILLWNKEYRAVIFGAIIAPIIYLIDAYIWWNNSAGPGFPPGTFIREYWIGGVPMPHPLGQYWLAKFGADFMMTISYTLFTFPWLFIVFKQLRRGSGIPKKIIAYTLLWIGMWFLTPLLSIVLPLDNTPVETVRHMHSQFTSWIVNLFIGYGLLAIVYRKNLTLVLRVLAVGVFGALVMELPLYLFRIRPTGILFVLFEGFFLLNQGVPYLFLLFDKVIPGLQRAYSNYRGRKGSAEAVNVG